MEKIFIQVIKINTPQNESFQEDGGRTAGNVLLHKNSGMLEEVPKLTFSKVTKIQYTTISPTDSELTQWESSIPLCLSKKQVTVIEHTATGNSDVISSGVKNLVSKI